MTVSATTPAYPMYPGGLAPDMPGHQLTYTGVAPGGKRLPTPSFHALLEIFNPLEHLPIVSTIYEALTGNHPTTGERIVGDTLYGGPIGFAGAVAETMVSGVVKAVEGKGSAAPSAPTALAAADAPSNAAGTVETGGQAAPLGLAPAGEGPAKAPMPEFLAQLSSQNNAPIAAEPGRTAPTPASMADDASGADPGADPGAISGPIAGTGAALAASAAPVNPNAPVPTPLAPPNAADASAQAAAPTAASPSSNKPALALADNGHKPAFMPLPQRGPRFFPLNNAPGIKTFYRAPAPAPAPASSPASAAEPTSSAASPAPSAAASSATPTPSALAAALAPALDQPVMPSFSPADSLSNPLMPSLSPAALATTEAATEKYNQALDLAQKLKFFYGGAASRGGPTP